MQHSIEIEKVLIFKEKYPWMEAKVYSWYELEEEVTPSFSRKLIMGEKQSWQKVFIKKGNKVPLHRHPHEQISYVTKGTIKFTVDKKDYIVKEEQVLLIPSNAEHGAEALEDSVALETFSPAREDWIKK